MPAGPCTGAAAAVREGPGHRDWGCAGFDALLEGIRILEANANRPR